MNKKIEKFKYAQKFKCNICNEALFFSNGASLKCCNNHNYDISSKGYLNFVLNRKENNNYTKDFFINRNVINQQGFYKHILDELVLVIRNLDNDKLSIVDLGCGEGYYLNELSKYVKDIYGFDYSKEAILFAAKQNNLPFWSVADIAAVPLQNESMDVVLNIFSPANYNEFKRILKDDGLLIKVVPEKNHFIEFRDLFEIEEYSNREIIDYYKKHFEIIGERTVEKTFSINQEQAKQLLKMTPVAFNIDDTFKEINVNQTTIAARILIGRKKDY